MAGQGVERREVLRIMGIAALAAQFPGFSKWAFACGHVGNAALQIKPASYHAQFFSPAEYATVEQLVEIIIPGAKEAGVAEFIDFMVSNDSEVQYNFRTGLTWLDAHSARSEGKRFVNLPPERQTALLEPLAYRAKARPGEEAGRRFFALVREFTVTGYYTSEIGYRELDSPALKFYAESPECPHKDDPEHLHLSHTNS